ncbi:MAG: DUF6766 family protein [Burkholderiaceae bacterium]
MRISVWKAYGFAWITGALFVLTLLGHWAFGWFEYVHVQQAHGQPVEPADYAVQMARGMLENWQSEFLQLLWQVMGLTYLLYIGSPQSKEEDDRLEEKLDALLRRLDPEHADALIRDLDRQYPGRHVGPRLPGPRDAGTGG